MVLGLLDWQPWHGYAMRRFLEESNVAYWADVLPGSIYQALKQMTREGLVEVQETELSGHRLKAVYQITGAGRAEFRHLLRQAMQGPTHPVPTLLYTALTFLQVLPPKERLEAVEDLIPKVEEQISRWRDAISRKPEEVMRLEPVRLLFDNGREHLEADLRMLRQLREALRADLGQD
jgi:DNA-binding PadR family transcriptional regulator